MNTPNKTVQQRESEVARLKRTATKLTGEYVSIPHRNGAAVGVITGVTDEGLLYWHQRGGDQLIGWDVIHGIEVRDYHTDSAAEQTEACLEDAAQKHLFPDLMYAVA